MRRLFRWTFNFAAIVSALLFVGACVLCVRSISKGDRLALESFGTSRISELQGQDKGLYGGVEIRMCDIDSGSGRLYVSWFRWRPKAASLNHILWWRRQHPHVWEVRWRVNPGNWDPQPDGLPQHTWVGPLGFLFGADIDAESDVVQAIVPFWSAVIAAAALPMCWVASALRRARRQRRRHYGLCVSCGYDMRASSERCPECGCAPTKPQSPAIPIGAYSPPTQSASILLAQEPFHAR
jgi:hypothetical protein